MLKRLICIMVLLGGTMLLQAQSQNVQYDSTLAQKLGADDYGMKTYVFVILKTGTNTRTEKPYLDSCFSSHMANIHRMVELGKLIVAGPMYKNEKAYRGLFIFDVPTEEEAKTLMQADAAIREGILDVEMFKWYGSAALPLYLDESDKIWKVKP